MQKLRKETAGGTVPLAYSLVPSADSGPSLVDEFAEQAEAVQNLTDTASRVLIDCDELSDLLEKAKTTQNGKNTLFTELLKLYEGNITGNRTRKHGKKKVTNAHLAILGGVPEKLCRQLWTSTGAISTGLQSRVTLSGTNAGQMPVKPRPSDLATMAVAIPRIQKQLGRDPVSVKISPEAAVMLQGWWEGVPREKDCEARIPDLVKRLLIVLAVTNDTDTVSPEMMSAAIQFGDYQIALRERFIPSDSWTWEQAFENDIIALFKKRPSPKTQRQVMRAIHPERRPGGYKSFMNAFRTLVSVERLSLAGNTGLVTKRPMWKLAK